MTNAELIQTIRNEIERRIRNIENCPFIEADFGASVKRNGKLIAYKDLLSFLDTLESEAKEDKKIPTRIYLGSRYEFIRKDILLNEIERLKKNNEVSDDKEYSPYELDVACGYDMACNDILSFFKPFAEVDKHPKNILAPSKECEPGLREPLESEKPMQDGLEEEIQEYMSNDDNNPYDWDWRDKRDCARHFAQWGAEHLKK